jgi:CBS domain-containing protein
VQIADQGAEKGGIGATATHGAHHAGAKKRHLHGAKPFVAAGGLRLWRVHAPRRIERMKTVAEILKAKGDSVVYSIEPSATVYEALTLMADKNVGALLVMEAEKIVGMVTERDYARKVVLLARSSKDTPLRDVMTPAVIYVRPDQTTEDCMGLMTQSRIRHLPVMDDGKLVGLISIGDLVKGIMSEQTFIIEQLQHYIAG